MINEPLAIVGIGCRFPAGVEGARALWRFLCEGRDAIREVPPTLWNQARYYGGPTPLPGRVLAKSAGFLDRFDEFDAGFFGMSEQEAAQSDPQHRVMLEVAWEAIEDAGIIAADLAGTETGVFIGISGFDYTLLTSRHPSTIGKYSTAAKHYMAANRISYRLDLRGPSVAVDAACATSLVALDMACASIWSGRCDLALAGGVNLVIVPESSIGLAQLGALSPDGRSKPFSEGADGYGRSSAGVAVLIEPLSKAIARRDPIYCLVRASATNHIGFNERGWMVPGESAQIDLLERAYRDAGIDPARLSYLEAHGTGTQVGDQIEAAAIAKFLERTAVARAGEPLPIGSIKGNVGHCEAAAGLAGLCKAALILEQGSLVPNLHFDRPNPKIDFSRLALRVPTALEALPAKSEPSVAGVSSFGVGGSNVHVVLEEWRAPTPEARLPLAGPWLFPISGHQPAAVDAAVARHLERLRAEEIGLPDLSYTLCSRRQHHPHRIALVAETREELIAELEKSAADPRIQRADGERKIAFIFSGMGPQWWGMGRQLLDAEPVFRESLRGFDRLWVDQIGWSILAEMRAPEASTRIGRDTEVSMAAGVAMQVAMAALWRSLGVEPDAIAGHSVGELAAAHVAGALTLDDLVRFTAARVRCVAKVRGLGTMLAVGMSSDEIDPYVRRSEGRVRIAAINAPRAVTLAGDRAALIEIERAVGATAFCRLLAVDVPFHGWELLRRRAELEAIYPDLGDGGSPSTPFVSSTRGDRVDDASFGRGYWVTNLVEPVRFHAAIDRLLDDGVSIFFEVGPHPVLAHSIRECIAARSSTAQVVTSLERDGSDRRSIARALGALHTLGRSPSWSALHPTPRDVVRLPPYPWQRTKHWVESAAVRRSRLSEPDHPLLGRRIILAAERRWTWENELYPQLIPFLKDHRIRGDHLFPGSGYLEMALVAARAVADDADVRLFEVKIHQPLYLQFGGESVFMRTSIDPVDGTFEIFSASPDHPQERRRHASGRFRAVAVGADREALPSSALRDAEARCVNEPSVEAHYAELWSDGFEFGPSFRSLTKLRTALGEAVAEIHLTEEIAEDARPYRAHPVLLDGALQSSTLARLSERRGGVSLPSGFGEVWIDRSLPRVVRAHARSKGHHGTSSRLDIRLYDPIDGRLVGEITDYTALRVPAAPGDFSFDPEDWMYQEEWIRAERPSEVEESGRWLILAASDATRRLARALAERAEHATITERFAPEDLAHGARATVIDLRGLDRSETSARELRDGCWDLISLAQSLAQLPNQLRMCVVTRAACAVVAKDEPVLAQAPLWGVGRVILSEHPELSCTLLDLDAETSVERNAEEIADEIAASTAESEVAWRAGQRHVCRISKRKIAGARTAQRKASEGRRLGFLRAGSVDQLRWIATPIEDLAPTDVRIRTRAAALNFRDLMKVMGIYPAEPGDLDPLLLGDECAGEITAVGSAVRGLKLGDRIVARRAGGSMASVLDVPAAQAITIPSDLAYEDAVTVPVAFSTVYYALGRVGGLKRGESILIHSAAGGVGLAAVQYAQRIGAKIFATAGSEEKRGFLRSLGVEHVMDSRTLDFAEETLAQNGGRGVDVVLNSLSGAAIPKSLATLASFGRFLEIGKRDIYGGTDLSLAAFKKCVSYHAIDLARLWRERPAEAEEIFREVARDLASGAIQPLPKTVFAESAFADAFRFMAQARHTGKVVLSFSAADEEAEASLVPLPEKLRARFDPNASYLITGGLGAFGIALAEWLRDRGARSLVLMSRKGAATDEQRARVRALEESGASVTVAMGDVADEAVVRSVLSSIERSQRPLGGIFHAAGVLSDATLANSKPEQLDLVMAPKISGALNLHRAAPRDLPLFVLFSSAAVADGNPGQAAYVAANRALDGLAQQRAASGLAALSVGWGVLASGGMTKDRGLVQRFAERGTLAIQNSEAFELLERALAERVPHLIVNAIDWKKRVAVGTRFPARFAGIVEEASRSSRRSGSGSESKSLRNRLAEATPEEAQALLLDELIRALARISNLGRDQVGAETSIASLGLDSLMNVELVNWVRYEIGVTLGVSELAQRHTLAELASTILTSVRRSPSDSTTESTVATGTVPLTPFQRRYLEGVRGNLNHINLSAMLEVRADVSAASLLAATEAVIAREDVFRLRFAKRGDAWQQLYSDRTASVVTPVDLTGLPESRRVPELERRAAEAQASLDIVRGPVARVLVFDLGAPLGRRLLVIAHWLIIDAISLRVLCGQIHSAIAQVLAGEPIQLPPRISFVDVCRKGPALPNQAEMAAELAYWLEIAAKPQPSLRIELEGGANDFASGRRLLTGLDEEETQRFFASASQSRTPPTGLLMAAYAFAFRSWTGGEIARISTTTHGRDTVDPSLDLSSVIGRLAGYYPAYLDISGAASEVEVLDAVAAQLGRVPRRGATYALMEDSDQLARIGHSEVQLDYLGNLFEHWQQYPYFRWASESKGSDYSASHGRPFVFRLSGFVAGARLQIELDYSVSQFHAATAERLLEGMREALVKMVMR